MPTSPHDALFKETFGQADIARSAEQLIEQGREQGREDGLRTAIVRVLGARALPLRRRPRTTERFRRLARLFSADRSAIL